MLHKSTDQSERDRLLDLARYDIVGTPPEGSFDLIVRLAANMFRAPMTFISFVDETRQWLKSRIGIDCASTPREISFCHYAILGNDVLMIPDTRQDSRVFDNPLVVGPPYLRFYAGAPVRSRSGYNLGALCIADRIPRSLNERGLMMLRDLSVLVSDELELRRKLAEVCEEHVGRENAERAERVVARRLDEARYEVIREHIATAMPELQGVNWLMPRPL